MRQTVMAMQNAKIKIGVVGCGKIATNHFDAIVNLKNQYELISICDSHPDTLNQATAKLGVKGFDSLAAMLEKSEVDVITLCSPSGLHAQQAIHIAQHGKTCCDGKTDGNSLVRRYKNGECV